MQGFKDWCNVLMFLVLVRTLAAAFWLPAAVMKQVLEDWTLRTGKTPFPKSICFRYTCLCVCPVYTNTFNETEWMRNVDFERQPFEGCFRVFNYLVQPENGVLSMIKKALFWLALFIDEDVELLCPWHVVKGQLHVTAYEQMHQLPL